MVNNWLGDTLSQDWLLYEGGLSISGLNDGGSKGWLVGCSDGASIRVGGSDGLHSGNVAQDRSVAHKIQILFKKFYFNKLENNVKL